MSRQVNSWDVFDTLIGRLCYKPEAVFDIIEAKTGIANFSRIRSEARGETLNELYDDVARKVNYPDIQTVKAMETEIEYDLSFPIYKHLRAVKSDDILISDMYLSADIIRAMLEKNGPMKNRLIVTNNGKASGRIWADKDLTRQIATHSGDNHISDYINPKKVGLNATWISNVHFTTNEEILSRANFELAALVRAVRLSTQERIGYYHNIFVNVCLPLGLLICLYIRQLINIEGIDTVYFLSRDGYWFHELFGILFPDIKIEYKYFSRLLLSNSESADKFVNEINSVAGKKLLVDLNGTGKTVNSILDRMKNTMYLLCFTFSNDYISKSNNRQIIRYKDKSGILKYIDRERASEVIKYMGYVERIFFAPHGSIDANGNVMKLEYDVSNLADYMKGVRLFKQYFNTYASWWKMPTSYNLDKITNVIVLICAEFTCGLNESVMDQYFPWDQSHSAAAMAAVEYGSNKHYIERVSKFKCNGVFLDIGAHDGNNTQYLEQTLNWRGILVESNPEKLARLRSFRSSTICDRALGKNTGDYVDILLPEGGDAVYNKYMFARSVKVKTVNINDLLRENNISEIDYMALSAFRENHVFARGELEILNELDFNTYKIHYIQVEHGGSNFAYQTNIRRRLESKGYVLSQANLTNDEYVLP